MTEIGYLILFYNGITNWLKQMLQSLMLEIIPELS